MKDFRVRRSASKTRWIVECISWNCNTQFPCDLRAFDDSEDFRLIQRECGILYITETMRLFAAIDWLMENDWQLDLSRCDDLFLDVYPVTAAPPVPLECVRCRGDGVIYITLPPTAGYHDDGSRECPDCDGLGVITEEVVE